MQAFFFFKEKKKKEGTNNSSDAGLRCERKVSAGCVHVPVPSFAKEHGSNRALGSVPGSEVPLCHPGDVVPAAQEGSGGSGTPPGWAAQSLGRPGAPPASPRAAAVFTFCLPSIIINSGSLSGGDRL